MSFKVKNPGKRFCETYTPYDFSKDAKYWRKAD